MASLAKKESSPSVSVIYGATSKRALWRISHESPTKRSSDERKPQADCLQPLHRFALIFVIIVLVKTNTIICHGNMLDTPAINLCACQLLLLTSCSTLANSRPFLPKGTELSLSHTIKTSPHTTAVTCSWIAPFSCAMPRNGGATTQEHLCVCWAGNEGRLKQTTGCNWSRA